MALHRKRNRQHIQINQKEFPGTTPRSQHLEAQRLPLLLGHLQYHKDLKNLQEVEEISLGGLFYVVQHAICARNY